MMSFPYRCPRTGYQVTGWQEPGFVPPLGRSGADGRHLYVAERCPACGGLHIVNPLTGRMLAEERVVLTQIKAQPGEPATVHP
ncbi:hypothetical protein [Reyranella sp.]|uniref:hypothetical protein n=1 Tax=Reyranella sp. TaxID=1929291 RepID=UPI003BAA127E